jgi:hypothetical protein
LRNIFKITLKFLTRPVLPHITVPGFDVQGRIVCLGEAVDMNQGKVIRPLRHIHVTHQALQQQTEITVLRIRIRDPVPFLPLDPGSGIGFFRIPDPKPIYLSAW